MASDLAHFARLDRATMADLVRAGIELGLARWRLATQELRSLVAAKTVVPGKLDPRRDELVERVAYAIPRVAGRLPWRADCLVQALAAERWLRSAGIISTLHFGIPQEKSADFEAHAWLTVGERIVTGGNVDDYLPLAGKR